MLGSISMRSLVTGATGFVGRALIGRLRDSGHEVLGLARTGGSTPPNLVVRDLSLLDPDDGVCAGIDVVYHLAAKTHDIHEQAEAAAEYERTNVEGTRRLVATAQAGGVRRFVFVSSVKVLDEGNQVPATEDTTPQPLTPYGRSKLEAERIVWSAAATGAFEATCLRFPLVYGPSQRGNLQRMVSAIARGTFLPPPRTTNNRSMLHVENAVDALVLAGTHPAAAGQTYLVTDGRAYSTREIYDGVRAALGRSPSRLAVPGFVFRALAAAGDVARLVLRRRVGFDSEALQKLLGSAVYDSSRIVRELGYAPTRDLMSSLPGLVNQAGEE